METYGAEAHTLKMLNYLIDLVLCTTYERERKEKKHIQACLLLGYSPLCPALSRRLA